MSDLLNDPKRWYDCAEEARVQATQMHDVKARAQMLDITEGYERLGKRAEVRLISQRLR
jgi:hypothetical protein